MTDPQSCAIDRSMARRHLSLLDPLAVDIIWLLIDDKGQNRRAVPLFGPFVDLRPRLERAQRDGFAVHVCVNAMRGWRRRSEDLLRVRAVFAELDGPVMRPFPMQPSLEIETSPGRRHLYWLADPADPPTAAEATGMLQRIADYHGADRQAADVARVLRLAGSWHQKGLPHRVTIVSAPGNRCSRADLLAAFPPAEHSPRAPCGRWRGNAQIGSSPGSAYVATAVRGVCHDLARAAEGTRNSTLNRGAFRLGQLGVSLDAATTALAPIARAIGLIPTEITSTIRSGHRAGAAKAERRTS